MKSALRWPPVIFVLGFLIWLWMVIVARTVRLTIEGEEPSKDTWNEEAGIVISTWHSRLLLLPMVWIRSLKAWPAKTNAVSMIISLSRDGEAVDRAMKHLGISTIRGSSTNKKKRKDKGGVQAIAKSIRHVKSGGGVCITPDGPRGPREKASDGAALLAIRGRGSMMTLGIACKPATRLKTWDRLIIPWPFAKCALVYGTPIEIDPDEDTASTTAKLQASLAKATARAEAIVGAEPLADIARTGSRRS